MDGDGNVLVADTGNKRIVRYTADGQYIDQIGGGGVILGRFDEPTSVAVSPVDGSIYVADTWNRRIQQLGPDLTPLAEWPVPGWESQNIYNKPSLTVDTSGNVYASDPELYRVLVFDRDGKITTAFGNFGTGADSFASNAATSARISRRLAGRSRSSGCSTSRKALPLDRCLRIAP